MHYDICCVGHITLDRVVSPTTDVFMPGGTSFYFSHAIANMNVSYLLVTALAEAESGAVRSLQEKGIEAKQLPSQHTVYFENIYGDDHDKRTQRVLQVADAFKTNDLDAVEARIFHLGPLLANDIPNDLIRSLATKGRVSLDVQGLLRSVEGQNVVAIDWKSKLELLPFIHFLKASEEEMRLLTGEQDTRQGAKMLSDWGVQEVIITLGSKGSVIYHEQKFYFIPAYVPAQVKDATGCGDTYMAGYLSQRVRESNIKDAGEFAAAMATLKIESAGPFKGTMADVEKVRRTNRQILPA